MNSWSKNIKSNPPALCVIGHISIDEVIAPDGVYHSHIGGSAYATAVGAALVSRQVGIVSRVGVDFPNSPLLLKRISHYKIARVPTGRTSRFFLDYRQANVLRGFRGELGVGADISTSDIPKDWLTNSLVYVATMPPGQQLGIIRSIRAQSCSRLSADLLEAYISQAPSLSLTVANEVDILFVNEFEWGILQSLNCRRRGITVVKRGARGAAIYLGKRLLMEGHPYETNAVEPY